MADAEMDGTTTSEGSCICGAARFTAEGLKAEYHACHCPICQKWSGGPFVGVEAARVTFADEGAVTVYQSSEWAERVFCRTCGASLVWRLRDHAMPMVAAPALDTAPPGATLTLEYFIDTKPEGYAMAGDHTRLTRAETEAMFAEAPTAHG